MCDARFKYRLAYIATPRAYRPAFLAWAGNFFRNVGRG